MKTLLQTNLQFSGYPLKVVEDPIESTKFKLSKVIRLNGQQKMPSTDKAANDPLQWDAAWFTNYE